MNESRSVGALRRALTAGTKNATNITETEITETTTGTTETVDISPNAVAVKGGKTFKKTQELLGIVIMTG